MKRLAVIVIAMLTVFTVLFAVADRQGWLQPEFVEAKLAAVRGSAGGQAAVAGAVIGLLVVDIVLPVPSSIVMVVSGKFLGPLLGGLVSFIGAMLAAVVGFYACRWGGQRMCNRLIGQEDTARITAWFENYGVYAIIISRPIPMLTEVLSCIAGLSRFKARTFFLAAVVGTLPICFVYSFFGSRGSIMDFRPAIAIALMVPAIGWLIARRINRQPGADTAAGSSWMTWGRLLRLPNLFTVPGEAVAGYVLATGGSLSLQVLWPALAVLLIYMGGLLLNDYFDREEDARERPNRPIPSGAADARVVLAVGMVLSLAGPALLLLTANRYAALAALVTAGLAISYDGILKRNRFVGPIAMGLCRGGSVIVGALAATGAELPSEIVWIAAGIAACYTLAVTLIAMDETKGESPGFYALLPMIVVMTALVICVWQYQVQDSWEFGRLGVGCLLFLLAVIDAAVMGTKASYHPEQIPKVIGRLIRNMLILQAGWIILGLSTNGLLTVLAAVGVFVAIRIAADLASRKFYGS